MTTASLQKVPLHIAIATFHLVTSTNAQVTPMVRLIGYVTPGCTEIPVAEYDPNTKYDLTPNNCIPLKPTNSFCLNIIEQCGRRDPQIMLYQNENCEGDPAIACAYETSRDLCYVRAIWATEYYTSAQLLCDQESNCFVDDWVPRRN